MKIEYFPIQLELLVNRSNEYNKILTNKMPFITQFLIILKWCGLHMEYWSLYWQQIVL